MNNKDQQINISKMVLNTIEDQKVKPKPKWYFLVGESGIWILGAITTFCGSITISTILFIFSTIPFRLQNITQDNIVKFWLEFIPLLWIVLFISFIFITDYFFKKTKKGYRYSFLIVSASSIFLSIIIGYIGFTVGIGEYVEENVSSQIPFYTPTQIVIQRIWSQPSKGLIAGQILDDVYTLQTNEGNIYNLDISHLSQSQKEFVTKGSHLSLIGTTTKDNIFFVCMVIPSENKDFLIKPSYFERKELNERINICKDVRPYEKLKNNILNYEN